MLPEAEQWAAALANSSRAGAGAGLGAGADGGGDDDNTLTFLVGFGVLVLFVLGGVLASVFLCVTLKKDPYLWDAGPDPELCPAAAPQPLPQPLPQPAAPAHACVTTC